MADVDTSWLSQLMPGQGTNPLDTLMQMKDLQYRDAQIANTGAQMRSTQALEQYRQMQALDEMRNMQAQDMFGQLVQQSMDPETGEMDYDTLISLVASNPVTARMFPELAEQLVNMNKTTHEIIGQRLENDSLKAEATARAMQPLLQYRDGVTKEQISSGLIDAMVSMEEMGALDDSDRSQIIDQLIQLEGMQGPQLAQFVQGTVTGALSAKDALDTILNPSNPIQREADAMSLSLQQSGYSKQDADFIALAYASGRIKIEPDPVTGALRAIDITGSAIPLEEYTPELYGVGERSTFPALGPGGIPLAPGTSSIQMGGPEEAQIVPAAAETLQAEPELNPVQQLQEEYLAQGIPVDARTGFPDPRDYPYEAAEILKASRPPPSELFPDIPSLSQNVPGLASFLTNLGAGIIGQFRASDGAYFDWTTDPENLQVAADRRYITALQRAIARASSLSDRYAVGEQELISQEMNMSPNVLSSPETFLAEMVAINETFHTRLAQHLQDSVNPSLPDDQQIGAAQAAQGIADLLRLMSIPRGTDIGDLLQQQSGSRVSGEAGGVEGLGDAYSIGEQYIRGGGDPRVLDRIRDEIMRDAGLE